MIRNARTGELVAEGEIHCRTALAVGLGLRFRSPRAAVLYLGWSRRCRLDMCFVGFPIDALFLDEQRCLVEVERNLRPWRSHRSRHPCSYVLELPHREELDVQPGDRLEF